MKNVWVSHKKLPSGEWRIRFRGKGRPERGFNLPGTLHEKTIKEKVIWYKEQVKQDYYNPWEKEDEQIRLYEAVDDYIRDSKPKWSTESYKTELSRMNKMQDFISASSYLRSVEDWNWFNDLPIRKHKQDEHGYSPRSLASYYTSTRTFLNYCVEQGYIETYKLTLDSRVVRRINQSTIKYITHDELSEVINEFLKHREQNDGYEKISRYRHTRLWWVMFWQALRKNEPLQIKKEFINLKTMKMKVLGKGGTMHWIPIVPPAEKHIRWFLENPRPNTKNIFGLKSMASSMEEFRKFVGEVLPYKHNGGFHQLRHGGAVHYLTSGVPLIFVSKLLRHKSTQITSEVYADIIEGMEGSAFDNIKDEPLQ